MRLRSLTLPAILATLALAACSPAAPGGSSSSGSATSPTSFIPYTEAAPAPAADVRVVSVEAKNFAFVPSAIMVKKGEKVALKVTATSGHHGIMSADLGFNVKVDEGQTVFINVPTDKTGTFAFRCSVPCGPGHKEMTGTITIQ
jgi:heme/copper-type cytochrome/quinol oxidase subunit 2